MDSRTVVFIEALNAVDVVYSGLLWNNKNVEPTSGGVERVRSALNALICVAPPEIVNAFMRCTGLGSPAANMEDLIQLRRLIRHEFGLTEFNYISSGAIWLGKLAKAP